MYKIYILYNICLSLDGEWQNDGTFKFVVINHIQTIDYFVINGLKNQIIIGCFEQ